jgi:hypothetical protein
MGRGLSDSEALIVVTVSSKEFLGTLRTRFACGKLAKIVEGNPGRGYLAGRVAGRWIKRREPAFDYR